jgi:membrane fusion protein, copper/silver efflux system
MKINKKTLLTGFTALAIGLVAGWLIFGGSDIRMAADHDHALELTDPTIWTCSMHPQIRRDEPGTCPICSMDLIPLESEEASDADPSAIRMSSAAMQLARVSTAQVEHRIPEKSIRLNGKIQADQRLIFSQPSHIPGRIESLLVNFTGEFVTKGQPIALVYSPELTTAQEELLEAFKMRNSHPKLFLAAEQKLRNWKLSDRQVEDILKSGKVQTDFPILADTAGHVTDKRVNPGDYVQPGTVIYQITDLSHVWALFDVYETDLSWIREGDMVEFIIPSVPGKRFQGPVAYLDPVIDPETRVSRARVEVINDEFELKPEMFISGTLNARLHHDGEVIAVPSTAVMWTGRRSVVYVKTESDTGVYFKMREVSLGAFLGEHYIVEQGLDPGEEIAVHGTFSIDAAAQLAGKPSMMRPEGGPAMTGHDHGAGALPAQDQEPDHPEAAPHAISETARDALEPVYSLYLNYKDALVADNLAQALDAAQKMQETLEKIDMALFSGDAHQAWMKFKTRLSGALAHAPHFNTLAEARQAFQQVSDTMIAVTRAFTPLDQPIYVQHCPMADNGTGADWLSVDREIRNPYFGQAMLTCGEVTLTID